MSVSANVSEVSSLDLFVKLAKRGRHGGASGGECAAAQLASAIDDHACRLDGKAIEGAIELLKMAKAEPWRVSDLLKG